MVTILAQSAGTADLIAIWAERGISVVILWILYKVVPVVWQEFKDMHKQGTGAINALTNEVKTLSDTQALRDVQVDNKLEAIHKDVKTNKKILGHMNIDMIKEEAKEEAKRELEKTG